MKTIIKVGIGVTVVGLGLLAIRSASAAEDPKTGAGLEGGGVRNGIRYEGCNHFELVSQDEVEAWGIGHKWKFAHWALKLDELRADPEPALIEAFGLLFPECPWPPAPGTTFGPERSDWAGAVALAKTALASLDMAVAEPSRGAAAGLIATAIGFGLRGSP